MDFSKNKKKKEKKSGVLSVKKGQNWKFKQGEREGGRVVQ